MPSGYTNRSWKGKFCGTYEIAAWAGVTKAQVTHWAKMPWFPRPVDEPKMGRIWDYKEVTRILGEHGYPRVLNELGKKVPRQTRTSDDEAIAK